MPSGNSTMTLYGCSDSAADHHSAADAPGEEMLFAFLELSAEIHQTSVGQEEICG